MSPSLSFWLLPSAAVTYVTLLALESSRSREKWLLLLVPLGLLFILRQVHRVHLRGRLVGPLGAARALLFGGALVTVATFGAPGVAALDAATSVGLLFAAVAAFLYIARAEGPVGLLSGHPGARSLDALFVSSALWTLTAAAALFRAYSPSTFSFDPLAWDSALVFSVMGSLLLLIASLGRTLLLRGLELGVADRARASVSAALAGTLLAVLAATLRLGPVDRVVTCVFLGTVTLVALAFAVPSASLVTKAMRGLLGLLLLAAPVALGGAYFALQLRERPVTVALSIAVLSALSGLIARSLSKPLGPRESAWLLAADSALGAALHPEPEVAVREVLLALGRMEPKSETRPFLLTEDPASRRSVDVAGYLVTQKTEFPRGVYALAVEEPERTLRLETLLGAQVRQPKVRSVVRWFEAHQAKAAVALMDEEGPTGLLILPQGARRSKLTLEEVEALGVLGRRLSGLVSLLGALKRAEERELLTREQAEASTEQAARLLSELETTRKTQEADADEYAAILRTTAFSPGARVCLQNLEAVKETPCLVLRVPPGVDARLWAASYHLSRANGEMRGPFVVLDATDTSARDPRTYISSEAHGHSRLERASSGTLVLLHASALHEEFAVLIAEQVKLARLRLVACLAPDAVLPDAFRGLETVPEIRVPSLAERAEDLTVLVLAELTKFGLSRRGTPFGIARGALMALTEMEFPGNEEELRGLLFRATARTEGALVELKDLFPPENATLPEEPPEPLKERSRHRLAPRARRVP